MLRGLELSMESQWNSCLALRETCQEQQIQFHVVIGGKVPQDKDPQLVADAAIALAKKYRINGFSLDDESDCAPRSTLNRFQPWMTYVNALAQGLHQESLQLSAAVQAMFGIQDVPYHPYCHPDVTVIQMCLVRNAVKLAEMLPVVIRWNPR